MTKKALGNIWHLRNCAHVFANGPRIFLYPCPTCSSLRTLMSKVLSLSLNFYPLVPQPHLDRKCADSGFLPWSVVCQYLCLSVSWVVSPKNCLLPLLPSQRQTFLRNGINIEVEPVLGTPKKVVQMCSQPFFINLFESKSKRASTSRGKSRGSGTSRISAEQGA